MSTVRQRSIFGIPVSDAVLALCAVLPFAISCARAEAATLPESIAVRVVVARAVQIADEVASFGTLSFLKKIDLSAAQDGILRSSPRKEGDTVHPGEIVARLANPQIELAVGMAENGVAQAKAAQDIARARLAEGRRVAESRLLGIGKAELEMAQARRELSEEERKQADRETLYLAGAIADEAIRSTRFALESVRERIVLMERDLEIRYIGLRDSDLQAAGITVPSDPVDRNQACIELSVAAFKAELAAADARLDAARKELASANLALSELTVRAPGTCVVGARYIEEGERLKRGDKILTLMDVGSLFAVAPVRESDALGIAKGMPATIEVDGASASFQGLVDAVSPVADAQSASFAVKIALRDPQGRLKPGMFARVTVITGPGRRIIVIPESALIDMNGKEARAFVTAGGLAAIRVVRVGVSTEEGREITEGLGEGEVVIDRPDPALREGINVRVVD
ncbi:MAG: efflux RND transporter periplasmic adaptor subunit [Spirochaetales bacterium]|nr:MAG: efflux RND transporter periplasmic adaptor subunit [Spirochaetales bacterium]